MACETSQLVGMVLGIAIVAWILGVGTVAFALWVRDMTQ